MQNVALILVLIVLARIAFQYAAKNSAQRHARYKMRARLADLVWRGRLTPVRGVRNGKILR
jgi:hypothetical protein